MRLTFFSILTYVQYLFEGFLIVSFADLFFHHGSLIMHLNVGDADGNPTYPVEFLAIVVFLIVGHANSTLAHLVLQEGLAKTRAFRPSYYFLNLVGIDDNSAREFRRRMLFYRPLSLIWKPFGQFDRLRIRSWLRATDHNPAIGDQDRDVFGFGFGRLIHSEDNDNFRELLMNFTFSRNMFSTLLVIGLLFAINTALPHSTSVQDVATQLNVVGCEHGGSEYSATFRGHGLEILTTCKKAPYEIKVVVFAYFTILLMLCLRFFYFFGVVSKNAIRAAVELPLPGMRRQSKQA